MGSSEQRAHPRVRLILQAQYPEDEGYLGDATENLSAEGAFVRTDRALQRGDEVELVLSFAGLLAPLALNARVAWVRQASASLPAGVGVRVPEEFPEDRARLASLLERVRAEDAAPRGDRPGYRVLLVEDNPHILEMYAYVIRKLSASGKLPIEIGVAKNGHDALQQACAQRFDLVITDLIMPVLDGLEFIRRMRAQESERRVPVVAISAAGAETAKSARDAGADVYLRKPVRFVDVVETVRALLKV
jgi:uncharacterized protein (TIGR02266 family)